jgi:hypothetical protein
MAQFGGMKLTNAGRNILAKALTGKPLKFTKAWAGDGYPPADEEILTMTDLVKPHREMEIADMSIPPYIGTAKITVVLSNKDMTAGFFLREIGLFAQDPDTGAELLYGYANSQDTADYMPGQDGADPVYYRFDLTVIVDQAKNITAVFSDNPLAVTHRQLDDRTDEIYREIRKRNDAIQHQINCLAQASMINSLEHMGQKHWHG